MKIAIKRNDGTDLKIERVSVVSVHKFPGNVALYVTPKLESKSNFQMFDLSAITYFVIGDSDTFPEKVENGETDSKEKTES